MGPLFVFGYAAPDGLSPGRRGTEGASRAPASAAFYSRRVSEHATDSPLLIPSLRGSEMIYHRMSQLAAKHGAVNLGQGAPNLEIPTAVVERAREAMLTGSHQYQNPRGSIELRRALAAHSHKRYGCSLDPECQVVVTTGAQDALGSAFISMLGPEDEVVFIEPFYNPCVPVARMTGATLRFASVSPPDFRLREERLREVMSERTKLVVYNSPNNPSGRILPREELSLLGRLCEEFDAYIVADEVYEFFTYDGHPHVSILELEEIRDRAVVVSSFAKTFLMTGWRVGWAMGAQSLVDAIRTGHQLIAFSLPGFLMEGARFAMEDLGDAYFQELQRSHQRKRDLVCEGLAKNGVEVLVPEGTFYLAMDIRSFGESDDLELCHRLPEEAGVSAIPMSLSWADRREARHLIRWCFAKRDEDLEEALRRFGRWLSR